MRTSRLLEVIHLLLNKRQQTAEELANHFDVSLKTIYRDVDTLSSAGIPISKQQGVNGGIVLSENYVTNRSKLTKSEEAALMTALEEIKKLPNMQLEYALKLMKQYFNEAATNWVNTDDISIDLQDKFHQVKRATIEKRVIEFRYFSDGEFLKYLVEPYELRITGDVWKILVRKIREKTYEEIFLARMVDIEIKTKSFTRRDIPEELCKKYSGEIVEHSFKIAEMNEEIINRFPIENFVFDDNIITLKVKVRSNVDAEQIQKYLKELNVAK